MIAQAWHAGSNVTNPEHTKKKGSYPLILHIPIRFELTAPITNHMEKVPDTCFPGVAQIRMPCDRYRPDFHAGAKGGTL
jgi:hypothetical protein